MRIMAAAGARRAAGLPVYDLSVGQPSTPAPAPVLAAARNALGEDRIGYTPALGLPALRHRIAEHYQRTYGLDVPAAQIAVTTGSSGAFLLAFLAAFDAGDLVTVPRPGYPAYRNLLSAMGCRVGDLACGASERFRPSAAALDALAEVPAGVIIGSPANPTGTMINATELAAIADWARPRNVRLIVASPCNPAGTMLHPEELAAISAWCHANGVRLISDEIYHGITYTGSAACAWQTSREAIVVQSFSKYFSMTGWRLGWLLVPEELVDAVDRLAGNFALCPPTLSQHAALAAFDAYDELDANVARYAANRDVLVAGLAELGIDQIAPADGAFYVYADLSRWTEDSLELSARLLADTGVAIASGIDFDPIDGGRSVRLCFAGDQAEMVTALDLLGDWLAGQR
jgi:aspartate/methionine/tyrosine aminotransferase